MRSLTVTFTLEGKCRVSWSASLISPGFSTIIMVSKRLILYSHSGSKQIPDMRRIFVLHTSLKDFLKLRHWPFGGNLKRILLSSPPPSLSYADVLPVRRWFCNYWWLLISSELLQSVDMVIVKEVICIKLIIRRNKAHKSGHYQFSRKCFKLTLLCWVQGKKKRGKDSLILPNQGSNLSERTKLCLTQWIH